MRLNLSVSADPGIANSTPCRIEPSLPSGSEQPTATALDIPAYPAAVITASKPTRAQRWSDSSVGLLRTDYPTVRPVRDIGAELDRSAGAIYAKARRLKLKRPQRGMAPVPSAAPLPDLFLDPAPEILEPALAPPLAITPPPLPKQDVKRTKLGGREGRWVRNDGALSVRMERLHLAGFHDRVIAAVLGLTSAAVLTRAWAINCPDREAASLRYDVEAARLVDRQAAPLPKTVVSPDGRKTLTRKRCNLKGDFFWGESKSRFCNDARRLPYFATLSASAPMHAW